MTGHPALDLVVHVGDRVKLLRHCTAGDLDIMRADRPRGSGPGRGLALLADALRRHGARSVGDLLGMADCPPGLRTLAEGEGSPGSLIPGPVLPTSGGAA